MTDELRHDPAPTPSSAAPDTGPGPDREPALQHPADELATTPDTAEVPETTQEAAQTDTASPETPASRETPDGGEAADGVEAAEGLREAAEADDAQDDVTPAGGVPAGRGFLQQPVTAAGVGRATLVLLLVLAVAVATLGVFLLGQRSVAHPPGEVRVVEGSGENLGYAVDVHASAHESVARISVAGGGVGSGFFYAPQRLVTNAHVVNSSPTAMKAAAEGDTFEVEVALSDGRTLDGTVLATDARLDLAVIGLKEDPKVPALPFAGSDDLVPGQPLAALGYPFGGDLMLTTGVLSGVSTNSRFAESDVQSLLLQTDVAVNPGNSGGPLLDASGAVVGMVTLRPDDADGRQVAGMTLALPADVVVSALDQLAEHGSVAYPVVGVLVSDAHVDHPVSTGAYVEEVTAGSGAARAGIRAGSVVVAVAGSPVNSAQDLIEALVGRRPGEKLVFTVADAAGDRTDAVVRLGER